MAAGGGAGDRDAVAVNETDVAVGLIGVEGAFELGVATLRVGFRADEYRATRGVVVEAAVVGSFGGGCTPWGLEGVVEVYVAGEVNAPLAAASGICAHWSCQSKRKDGEEVSLFHDEETLYNPNSESKRPSQTNLGSWPMSEEKVLLPRTTGLEGEQAKNVELLGQETEGNEVFEYLLQSCISCDIYPQGGRELSHLKGLQPHVILETVS